MPDTSTTPPAADRNLLFGILALQMDFISRDALIAAMHAWVLEKSKPLGQILVEQGNLTPARLSLLEALVQEHIEAHHNDPQQSLAALSSLSSVRQELSSVADNDLQASLSQVGDAHDRAEFHATEQSATQQERIEAVCDRFEAAWKRAGSIGQPPWIEEYLRDSPGPEQAVLLCELIGLDIDYRRLAGENASVAEYRARFPNLDSARLAGMLPAPRPAEPGSTIDAHHSRKSHAAPGLHYRILRPHAKGGLGEVFVAEDQELHREVALKEIQEDRAHDAVSRGRFLREAEITGGLEHPGIVPVYGLGQYADGRPFYAMRFIRGDSLKDAIERFHRAGEPGCDSGERTLELRKLLGRFLDVCNAIAYAHSRGVLHRDLKPGNIMLGPYGETLVVDWGLAKPVGRPDGSPESDEATLRPPSASGSTLTQMGSILGSPAYMSPEQAAGQIDRLGLASDIYSLGATLYSLLTGRAPVEGSDLGQILEKVQKGDFSRPRQIKKSVPPALEAVCLKAMALRVEDRYASPSALAEDIEHWLADEPGSAWQEPIWIQVRRCLRRHRLFVLVFTLVVLVIAMSFAVSAELIMPGRWFTLSSLVVIGALAAATAFMTAVLKREQLARESFRRQKDEAMIKLEAAKEALRHLMPHHDLDTNRLETDSRLRSLLTRKEIKELLT
jgi:serine/threonine protein kinase